VFCFALTVAILIEAGSQRLVAEIPGPPSIRTVLLAPVVSGPPSVVLSLRDPWICRFIAKVTQSTDPTHVESFQVAAPLPFQVLSYPPPPLSRLFYGRTTFSLSGPHGFAGSRQSLSFFLFV